MPLTKEQYDKLGYELFHQAGGGGYNEAYFAGINGVQHNLDSSTAQYLKGIGANINEIEAAKGTGYNTVGGSTVTNQFLEGAYGALSGPTHESEAAKAQQLNQAIASGNVAEVERLNPGFTLWNGAFVDKTKIPELQAQGATVQNGNVVGAPLSVPAGSPGAALQSALAQNPNLTPEQQHQASLQGTPIPGTTPVAPGQSQPQGQTDAVANPQANPNGQTLAVSNPSIPVSGKSGSLILTTPSQPTNAYNQVYKDARGNVFEMGSNDPISQADFQRRGLNIDHINRLDESFSSGPSTGPVPLSDTNPEASQTEFEEDVQRLMKDYDIAGQKKTRNETFKKLEDLQFKKEDEKMSVRDNPWLTTDVRERNLRAIDKKYERDENVLVSVLKYQDTEIDSDMAELKFLVTGIQEERNKAMDRAMAREEALADLLQSNPADFKEVQGGLYNIKTGKWIIPPKASGDGGFGNYTEDQLKVITKINNDVSKNNTYSKTTAMQGYVDNVIASLSQGTGVGDIAAINQFQKVIDEGAVTRDQDVALIQQSQSLANTLRTKIARLEKGEQLSPELRSQMRKAIEDIYTAQTKALLKDPFIAAKTRESELNGLTIADTILGSLGGLGEGGNVELDIIETINSNKDKYSREDLINVLIPTFPELKLDEIARYVYTYIPDKK